MIPKQRKQMNITFRSHSNPILWFQLGRQTFDPKPKFKWAYKQFDLKPKFKWVRPNIEKNQIQIIGPGH